MQNPIWLTTQGRRFEPVTAHDAKVQVTLHFDLWSIPFEATVDVRPPDV
jgi:hypothetical protein